MTKAEGQASSSWGRKLRVGALAVIGGGLCLVLGTLLLLGTWDDGFVVSSGSDHRDDLATPGGGTAEALSSRGRARSCAGALHRPESRDGWTTYCVGIPYGTWRCFEKLHDIRTVGLWTGATRKVSCASGTPLEPWSCARLFPVEGTDSVRAEPCPCDPEELGVVLP